MLQIARVAAIVALCSSMASAQDQAYYIGGQILFGADLGRMTWRRLGPINGGASLSDPKGLAWRPSARELWTFDLNDREIGIIDPIAMSFTIRSVASIPSQRVVFDVTWNPVTDRLMILDVESLATNSRWTITSFSPTTNQYSVVAIWIGSGASFGDLACDAAGNIWILGGSPFGIHVLEPGRSAPRVVSTISTPACNLAIERSSGTFYVHAGINSSTLSILDPATGAITPRAMLLGCDADFEVIEGACNPDLQTYGTGCPGSGGYAPILSATGCYNESGFLHLGLSYAPSGSTALLLFGLAPTSFPIGNGCSILIAPIFNDPQIALPLFGSGGAGRGFTAIGVSIPPGVVTTSLVTQAFVLDPGALGGFTMTNGVRFD